jgi:hypothetical protein
MPISETVAALAAEVEEQLRGVTPSQGRMLAALKDMPRYKELGNLEEWNARYRNARDRAERNEPNFKAIELVYEIGRYNLSTIFDKGGTRRRYLVSHLQLREQGILVSWSRDVSTW